MDTQEVKVAGATITNVLGEWRCALPRGEVLTNPDAILAWVFKRLQRSQSEARMRRALEQQRIAK